MGDKVNKSKVVSSLFWKLMERGGTQGVQFIVQIVLARLLLPEDFGTIAIVMVFIVLAQVFIQKGFNTALIQKKDADNEDFSSVFFLSIAVSILVYVTIFFTSPLIANFYNDPVLVPVLRVLSTMLFFGAFNSIQTAFVARNMMFKKLFYSSLGAMIISGVAGIAAAYSGLGIWALVLQQLLNQISITIIMWFTVKWRPGFEFSFQKIKGLFSYGWKLLVSSLITTIYLDLRTLIIGRIYNPQVLGYYNRGQQMPKLIIGNIDSSIQAVMLPALSSQQDKRKRVKDMMRRGIVTSSFLVFPAMVGLAVVAGPLVEIILTDKWLPAVPFMQIYCAVYVLRPIHTANLQAINAVGRSDIFLKLEVIKKILGISILSISIPLGVYAIALGSVFGSIISTFINAYPNKKLLDYSYLEQLKDLAPSFVLSLIMGGFIYTFSFLPAQALTILVLQIVSGIGIYIGLSKLFGLESFEYLVVTLKEIIKGKRGRKTDEKNNR